jgi:hypothetical protein
MVAQAPKSQNHGQRWVRPTSISFIAGQSKCGGEGLGSAALCSHVGTCCIGIDADGAAFPNIDSLWAAMQQGLDQVLALGK